MNPDAYVEMAHAEASHWWFCGRRAILSHLIGSFDLPAHARILEVGAGTGGNLEMLSAFGCVSAIEMDATARSLATGKTDGRFDIRPGVLPREIPFAGEKFELVCLFDVLEHIDADVETLIAIKPLLADGGRVLITVPAHQWLWTAHDAFLHHKRRYSLSDLRSKAVSAGYAIAKLSYFNSLLFPIAVTERLADKWLGKSPPGANVPANILNRLLGWIFGLERFLVRRVNLPVGLSIVCVLKAER